MLVRALINKKPIQIQGVDVVIGDLDNLEKFEKSFKSIKAL